MRGCFCAALGELTVLSDDPREETRLRRTVFGIEIQHWRLASMIVIPEGGGPASNEDSLAGAIPRAASIEEPTLENVTTDALPIGRLAHESA